MICQQTSNDSGIGYNEEYTSFITTRCLKIVFPFLFQPIFISVRHLSTPTVKLSGIFIYKYFPFLTFLFPPHSLFRSSL